METLAELVTACGLLWSAPRLWMLRRAWRGTALWHAWAWVGVAWLTLVTVRLVTVMTPLSPGAAAVGWYGAGVCCLAPGIAVLGGRWPTARVWSLFVVAPLLAVLLWPVAVGLLRGSRLQHWVLEEPMLVGCLLVLVMGVGNYVGSRWTLQALVCGISWSLLFLSLCPATSGIAPPVRWTGGLCCAACALTALTCGPRVASGENQNSPVGCLSRTWSEFQSLFGVVWSRRIQERFNEHANQLRLPVRLDERGWIDLEGRSLAGPNAPSQAAAGEPHLRWLLQKFVEPRWIDERLGSIEPPTVDGA